MARPQRSAKKQKLSARDTGQSLAVAAVDVEQTMAAVEKNLTQFDDRTATELSEVDAHISSEMGIIEEIYCENFMCHRKLRVALSPHINFITGENGSGKSAIIAALQLCLGATARSTHRGKNIKSLIRHGYEGNALVRITLRNDADGSDAFRPKEFGRKIMIERLIRRDGSAEYRLKDERGLLVSKLKTDLIVMLDHLDIQADNPCAILDQENAKLFLKGNPQDKYAFFLQATDLAKMHATYMKVDEDTNTIAQTKMKGEVHKMATLKKAMEEAERKWKKAQSIGKLEEELTTLKKELTWSVVSEKEDQITKLEEKMAQKKLGMKIAVDVYNSAKVEVGDLEQKQQKMNTKLQETNAVMNDHNQRQGNMKNEIRTARMELQRRKAEVANLTRSKVRASQRLSRLEDNLHDKRQHNKDLLLNQHSALQGSCDQKRQEVSQSEQELLDAKQRIQTHQNDMKHFEDEHDNCKNELQEVTRTVNTIQRRINWLRGQQRDSLALYGKGIPQLHQLIQQNRHRFTAPPIGPLGLHVKLPERFMHFAAAIELALKGALGVYLVVNGQDKHLLDNLKHQAGCRPNQTNIIITQRTGYRYQHLELADGGLAAHAICNILTVDDDEVFNALVDVCHIESKLLFEDRLVAERSVLRGSSGNFRMARFVSEVYLPDGDKIVVRSGNLAYIANKRKGRGSIISQDVEGELREQQQQLGSQNMELQRLSRDETHLQREREDCQRMLQQQKDRLDHLSRTRNRQYAELQSLEEELSDSMQQDTLDTCVLEDEVKAVQAELEEFQRREQQLNDTLSKCNSELEGPLQELEELDAIKKKIAVEMSEYEDAVAKLYKELSNMKGQEIICQREIEASQASLDKLQQQVNTAKQDYDEQLDKAQQVCPRPAELRHRASITKRTKTVELQLANVHQRLDVGQPQE